MIDQFNRRNIEILEQLGHHVEVAANFCDGNSTSNKKVDSLKTDLKNKGISYTHIPIPRKLFRIDKIFSSFFQTRKLIKDKRYVLAHLHSPVGAAIFRLANMSVLGSDLDIIYTAHGFHFYKGAPFSNWVIYYSLERLLAKHTKLIITINSEDFERAQSFHSNVKYVPGVGVDVDLINKHKVDKEKRNHFASEDEFIITSVGELNNNKNHTAVLQALSKIDKPYKYLICGKGDLKEQLMKESQELGISDRVIFLDFRDDILDILKISDVFCLPSKREGLSVALMEAMATGLPCLVSDIRGNRDLIDHEKGGYLFNLSDVSSLANSLFKLMEFDTEYLKRMGEYNFEKSKNLDKQRIDIKMKEIYEEVLNEKNYFN